MAHFQERTYHIIGINKVETEVFGKQTHIEESDLFGSYQTLKFAKQMFDWVWGREHPYLQKSAYLLNRFDNFKLVAHDVLSNGDIEKVEILQEGSA